MVRKRTKKKNQKNGALTPSNNYTSIKVNPPNRFESPPIPMKSNIYGNGHERHLNKLELSIASSYENGKGNLSPLVKKRNNDESSSIIFSEIGVEDSPLSKNFSKSKRAKNRKSRD